MTLAQSFADEVPLQQTLIGNVDSFETVCEFMRWLSASRGRDILAVDVESTGLNPWEPGAKVRLMQFGTSNEAWVVNAEKYPGLCQEVLETYRDTEFVFHNGLGFDGKFLKVSWPSLKFPWPYCHDTMLMCRIHDNEAPAGLKPVSERLFGKIATSGQRALEEGMTVNKWTWATVPMDFPAYSTYSALDVILTARLYRRMAHVHSGEFKAVYDLERDVRRICTEMEIRGMRIDVEYCVKKKQELDDYIVKTKHFCASKFEVQIGSTMQLGKWFENRGIPLTERTATGLPKMGKDELETVAVLCENHGDTDALELATYALKTRKADKLSGTYFRNLIDFSALDGRVHAQFNTMEARTGRQSVTSPALQTLPATGEGKTVRQAFIPTEGRKIYAADYSSIESRLSAHFARDANTRKAFRIVDQEGGDFFVEIGKGIYGKNFSKEDPRRRLIKTLVYAGTYGAGIRKMALSAGVSYETMQPIADAMFNAYPAIKRVQELASDEASANYRAYGRPYVTTPIGRRLYVDPDRMYTSANYLVQGHAAEVLKQAIVNIDCTDLADYLVLSVHDELVLDVPDEFDKFEVFSTIRECMEVTEDMGYFIPLPISPDGPHDRWGMGK